MIILNPEICLFTRNAATKVKLVVTNSDEPAEPPGGRGFAEWAMPVLCPLRIELSKSYRVMIKETFECQGTSNTSSW